MSQSDGGVWDWKFYGSSKGIDEVKTTYAVYQSCRLPGTTLDKRWAAIHTYGARKSSISQYHHRPRDGREVDRCCASLAEDDLSNTMPIGLKDEEVEIRAIILELRDEWFTICDFEGLVDGLTEL